MKVLFHLAVCGAMLATGAIAQRRGGGGSGGGFHGSTGGSFSHGGIASGGGFRAPAGGSGGGAFRNGFNGGGFRSGAGVFNRGFGGYRGFYGSSYYPYGYGFGYGYGYGVGLGFGYGLADWGSYDYPYAYSDPYYSYPAYQTAYPAYTAQPSVNVVYPPQQPSVYVERANPVLHEYDQYGQPVGGSDRNPAGAATNNSGGSPIYLIATKDHNIQAALSYSVNGSTLEYVSLDHVQKRVQLDQVDRDLSQRLNRERRVMFQLPAQQ